MVRLLPSSSVCKLSSTAWQLRLFVLICRISRLGLAFTSLRQSRAEHISEPSQVHEHAAAGVSSENTTLQPSRPRAGTESTALLLDWQRAVDW